MGEHDNHRDRVRQRILNGGLSSLQDHEIVEFLLFFGIPRKNTNPIAHSLISKFGSIQAVFDASVEELKTVKGMTTNAALLLSVLPKIGERLRKNKLDSKKLILSPRDIFPFFQAVFCDKEEESLVVACLDVRQRLLSCNEINGTTTSVSFSPRTIAEFALRYHAAGIIVAHNHPSEDYLPSTVDMQFTVALKSVLEALGICLIDHLIISNEHAYSFFLKKEISEDSSEGSQNYSVPLRPTEEMQENAVMVVKDKRGFYRKSTD